jgi:hypothetical protein
VGQRPFRLTGTGALGSHNCRLLTQRRHGDCQDGGKVAWASAPECSPRLRALTVRNTVGLNLRNRYEPVYLVPGAFALAGPAFLVVATKGGFLPLAVVWWAAASPSRASEIGESGWASQSR